MQYRIVPIEFQRNPVLLLKFKISFPKKKMIKIAYCTRIQ